MIRRLQLLVIVLAIFAALGSGASRLKAYATEGHAWGVNTVPYYVNPTNKYISTTAALAAFQSSAAAWTGYANVQLSYAGITSDASLSLNYVNEVFFRDDTSSLLAETYYWWDGTGHLVDADTVLHENWIWFSANIGCTNGYYVENTATHEFGHTLGLAHSAVDTATMWPSSGSCETIRETLDPDDITGLQSIYPGSPSPSTSTAPNAPSSLSVSVNASAPSSALNLAWVDNASNATGYVVERSADGVTFAQVASLGSNATSYADSGLLASTTYYYRAYAYNSVGASPYTNVASAITQAASAPAPTSTASAPSAPSNPSPSNGAGNVNTTVTLAWSDSGATSYNVYLNGSLYASGIGTASVKVSGLANGQSYSWSVVAQNSVGSTAGPNWSFTTSRKNGKK